MRSLAWNSAMPVVEAGIEEAFSHLQRNSNSLGNLWTVATINGQTVYQKQRNFDDGSYCLVTLSNVTGRPSIYSEGFVPAPLNPNEYISRKVRVGLAKPGVFTKAIAANGKITMSGGGSVDSFDSGAGPYSSGTRKANGSIATNGRFLKAIDVGTGHVYGTAETGVGGTINVAGGAVGDLDWNATQTGIQPGWSDDDMNVAYPTNSAPVGGMSMPAPVAINGSNITYLPPGSYTAASFTSSSSTKPMYVTGPGKSTLYVSGDLTVSGSGYIQIQPGASFELYIGGKFVVSGGGVVNGTQLAENFSYYGLPGNTTLTYSGSSAYIGTINAPQATATISGSAGAYGAAIVNTITISGGASFHYDEAIGGKGNYVLTEWKEL
jgi:hypothetical protein